jgi:hypothetical protein
VYNVYRLFPHCTQVVMWHAEYFEADREFLTNERDFDLFYSSFHTMESGLEGAVDLPYAGEFFLPGTREGTLAYWQEEPDAWMYKATYVTAVRLAWWMGATNIRLAGFDFSLDQGQTADDSKLYVPVKLRKYTAAEVLALQARSFLHLQSELDTAGVSLEHLRPSVPRIPETDNQ